MAYIWYLSPVGIKKGISSDINAMVKMIFTQPNKNINITLIKGAWFRAKARLMNIKMIKQKMINLFLGIKMVNLKIKEIEQTIPAQ